MRDWRISRILMFMGLERMTFIFKKLEKQHMEQVKVVMKYLGFGWYPSQNRKLIGTVQSKFLMMVYELNGPSHMKGKCDVKKKSR